MKLPPCDICGKPVPTAEAGSIWISFSDITKFEEGMKDWRAMNPGPILHVGAMADALDRPGWRWGHHDCGESEGTYWLDATRFETPSQALGWTLHLLDKTWFLPTRWDELVRRLHDVPYP